MRMLTPQRLHLTAVVALAAIALAVLVAVSVAWLAGGDSSNSSLGVEAPAPTPATNDPRGAVTDAGVNPWAFNDPATIMRFLAERCPDGPPVTSVDDLIPALRVCLASSP
jgi:hypothetical protein